MDKTHLSEAARRALRIIQLYNENAKTLDFAASDNGRIIIRDNQNHVLFNGLNPCVEQKSHTGNAMLICTVGKVYRRLAAQKGGKAQGSYGDFFANTFGQTVLVPLLQTYTDNGQNNLTLGL